MIYSECLGRRQRSEEEDLRNLKTRMFRKENSLERSRTLQDLPRTIGVKKAAADSAWKLIKFVGAAKAPPIATA